ncbi:hypothetical protein RRG08_013692 [Elysia crispata]|uniref:MULE transposase domain-containing protein n=1 Tax=Elysia crispata TaxID=231223 RepID=A0AAE0ZNL5_9GAST|nr:hypothetical protein RRG08_013692 [Elysia crispata]
MDVYVQFFQHITGRLHDAVTLPVIGSEEEKAMRTAIARAFPGPAPISCTRHICSNLKAFLADKVGLNNTNRNRIISELFAIVEDDRAVGDVSDRFRDPAQQIARKRFISPEQARLSSAH